MNISYMSKMLYALCIILILISLILIFYWINDNFGSQAKFYKTLPTPTTVPFFGHMFHARNSREFFNASVKFAKYGKMVLVKAGPIRKTVLVTDYGLIQLILSSTTVLKKATEYRFFKNWLGNGLLISDVVTWKKKRKIITPAFHFKILEQFVPIFESHGDILIEKLKINQNQNIDLYPLVNNCALDIICETAMGVNIDAQNNPYSEYVQSIHQMTRIVIERNLSPLANTDLFYIFTKHYWVEKKAVKILHKHSNDIISKKLLHQRKMSEAINNEFGIKKKRIFLDVLLNSTIDGRPLTQSEIREEVDTFMFEGHDTTSSCVSFTLFCLANYPDVQVLVETAYRLLCTNSILQSKALQEQISMFGDLKNCNVSYQDLIDMKYLDQVVKEVLRLYPSIPLIARESNKEIKFSDILIPKGVTFAISIHALLRDPELFSDPERFDPSRFENFDQKQPYSYIPFSAGPRNCIGQKYAMVEIKSIVSKVLRNFELSPSLPEHQLELANEIVLKSKNGVKINLRERNYK